jgi:hypothetical protein
MYVNFYSLQIRLLDVVDGLGEVYWLLTVNTKVERSRDRGSEEWKMEGWIRTANWKRRLYRNAFSHPMETYFSSSRRVTSKLIITLCI